MRSEAGNPRPGRATTAEFTAAVRRNLDWVRWSHAAPEDEASYEWGV